jgi:hypothetical protein
MSDQQAANPPDEEGATPFLEKALLALDGQLGEQELEALRVELAGDVAKGRLYVELCLQSQALSEALGVQLPGAGLDDRPRREDEERPRRDAVPLTARPWVPWSIAAAACVVALLTVGSILGRVPWGLPMPAPDRLRTQSPPATTAAVQPDRGRLAGDGSLAVLTEVDGATWEPGPEGGPTRAAGDVLGPCRLRLRSGGATLVFLTGVRLTLEGPADLDLLAIDRVFCRRGRLRAWVPKGAEGFVVASPASAVVDMGTEFALNVDADGRSRVMVFEGAAEAALLGRAGSPERTQLVERSKAFEIDPRTRRIAETDATPEGFVGAARPPVPALALDPDYAGAVLRSRPRGYWRFEAIDGGSGTVANEVPGGPPLRASGPVDVARGPAGNGCLVFRADAAEQFLTTDGPWELPRAPGHAVELWFLSEGISHASLVGFFPPMKRTNMAGQRRYVHSFIVELTVDDRPTLYRPASVRFLHRWPLDYKVGNNLISERVYVPRRWHHVVAQKKGDRMELYFDGVPEVSMPLEPDHPTLSCQLVVGRRNPDSLDPHDPRPFVGRLDELAIYDHPLSADEVRRHYRLARPEERPR